MERPAPLVALTRPRADCEALVPEVAARGWRCLIAPLLEIVPAAGPPPDPAGVQAVLVTSGNAVPALRDLPPDLPVYAVGDATAAAARAVHPGPVESARGAGRDLARLVAARRRPAAGALLHLAGEDVRPEPARSLEAAGFEVRRLVAYRARAVGEMPEPLRAALAKRELDAALLFSPRTARILGERVAEAGLTGSLAGVDALCLSPAVAAALAGLPLRRIAVAAAPERAALLALLEGVPLRC